MMRARRSTLPDSWVAGTPKVSSAAATFSLRSSNWTKRITFAVSSWRRSSRSFLTTTASFVPQRASGRSSAAPAAPEELAEGAGGAGCSSADTGLTSLAASGCRQMLQLWKRATVARRHSRQNVCAHGVMASLARASPSSRHTEQLRASGCESLSRTASVRRKKSSDARASRSSATFFSCSSTWPLMSSSSMGCGRLLPSRVAHASRWYPLRSLVGPSSATRR
mmetsp:Transcript_77019/g.217945  ORF Transcript_77019/g.217945 Transcript_77019/m.217945 type:complete len:223 (-) Transcript_77019:2104-2772(-)